MTDKIRSCVSTCGKTRTPGQQVPARSDRPLQGQPPRLTLRPLAHTQTPSVRTQHAAGRSPNTSLVHIPVPRCTPHASCPPLPVHPLTPVSYAHTHIIKGRQQPVEVPPENPNQQDSEPPPEAHRWHPQGRSAMPPPSET